METGRRSGAVIELAGVAGSGKSTLFRTLAADQSIRDGVRPCDLACVTLAARRVGLLPAGFLWNELRRGRIPRETLQSMVYLESWLNHLADPEAVDPGPAGPVPVVYDHGPFFRLAKLRAFGPTGGTAYQDWWESMREAWSAAMTQVVWLDAPDPVLLARIRKRNVGHPCEHMGDDEAFEWLGRYRDSFDESLRVFRDRHPASVLRFDTSGTIPEKTAASVVEWIGARGGD